MHSRYFAGDAISKRGRKIEKIDNFYAPNLEDTQRLFKNCENLITVNSIDIGSNVQSQTHISYMFSGCPNLKCIGKISVGNIGNHDNLFSGDDALIIPTSDMQDELFSNNSYDSGIHCFCNSNGGDFTPSTSQLYVGENVVYCG